MSPKAPSIWSTIGRVTLRTEYRVERSGDVFRVRSSTPRGADYGQSIDGPVIRYLAKALEGQTVTVEETEEVLRKCGLKLPYQYGHKLHFYAQNALVVLVASGQASHVKVGRRFQYNLA